MTNFFLSPADLADLGVRLEAVGWSKDADRVALDQHVWRRNGWSVAIVGSEMTINTGHYTQRWHVPVLSVTQVSAVLELAGVLSGEAA